MMKCNLLKTLAITAPALLLLAAAAGMAGCTADDDFGRLPEGSIPLEVGEVTVAGMKTNTRAAGYTGIRKSTFVDGDVLNLALSNDGGTTTTTVTATLTAGTWVLDAKTYVIPGTTTIKATHAATEVVAGIKPDALEAVSYALSGDKVTFSMKHTHAMIDITTPAGSISAGVTIDDITLAAHNGTADETLITAVEEEADGTTHYRTIALPGTPAAPGTVKSVTATINGMSYMATLATPLTVEANKRYPISLTFKANKLTATVGAALDWNYGGTTDIGLPAGYTRIIRTPEDLAQFAKDVNDAAPNAGARLDIVLQTADIDLSRLKPAGEAGINPLTGTAYTYTVTPDAWVPIGNENRTDKSFQGKYNGNGHTISNLKGSSGLFGNVYKSTLTGIHLRNVTLTNVLSAGSLANWLEGTTVTLCSATGSITVNVSDAGKIGGLIGEVASSSTVTRCSADVDIDASKSEDGGYVGGFVGFLDGSVIIACIATGEIDGGIMNAGGFGIVYDYTYLYYCMATGNVKGSACAAFAVSSTDYTTAKACYATGTVTGSASEFVRLIGGYSRFGLADCAYTGTVTSLAPGYLTDNVAVADLYATITANNIDTYSEFKTLHWSKEDGYTLTEVNRKWDALGVWQNNGTAAPTINMSYEGGVAPTAITTGNKVYVVNGYWVTAPGAETDTYAWASSNEATQMENDPCAGHDNWRMPTMKDFEKMAGLSDTWPWTDGVANNDITIVSDHSTWITVFPNGNYWSSVIKSASEAWRMGSYGDGKGYYGWRSKTTSNFIRCVQPITY